MLPYVLLFGIAIVITILVLKRSALLLTKMTDEMLLNVIDVSKKKIAPDTFVIPAWFISVLK